jgi:hypothetical protein
MRAQLEQKIAMFQQGGFDAFLEAEALAVQITNGDGQDAEKRDQVASFRAKAKNAGLAVARLKEILATLPIPELEEKE